MTRFWSILRVSFTETVRQPIYGVLLICTMLMMLLNVSLAAFTLSDDDKLLLELGLSTLLLSGLFLSAFSATSALSREIENKTVLTVISKPVSRPLFYLGKFFGLIGALALAHYLNTLVFLLAQRHGVLQNTSDPWDMPAIVFGSGGVFLTLLAAVFLNYFHGRDFPLTALSILTPLLTVAVVLTAFFDKRWNVTPFAQEFPGGQVVIATLLVLLFNMILAAVATAASTRFGQLMTLTTCVLFTCLAAVADYAFGQYAGVSNAAAAAYHIVPNLSPFWIIDGLFADREEMTVNASYLGYAAGYSLLMTAAFVNVGIALFNRREVG